MARMRTLDAFEAQERADKEAHAQSYQWYKAHGICVKCHIEDAVPGKVHCAECAALVVAFNKARAKRREAHGLCKRCGKPLTETDGGYKNCAACRAYNARKRAEWYARQKRAHKKK